ncbi:MAG: pyridoxamine kinase [Desemzia incerta]|uniref:pyridoxamine kinase n=1 Tax=Desemzia incerta TaxID=82801 RepID=UPI0033147C2D
MKQPKVLVIQDISASCQISMNVAVPILSSLNNSTHMLPTALLSTHTGAGFEDYTYLDLTSEMSKILDHWKQLGLSFDGVLVGYLGSHKQIEIVKRIIKEFATPEAVIVLDPVMGDHGELYDGFDEEYVQEMRELCQLSTVIIPNLTEAAYLTKTPYQKGPYASADVERLMKKMVQLNKKQVVLTGVMLSENEIGAASMTQKDQQVSYAFSPVYPGRFEGTGDVFSSVIAGFLFQQISLDLAMTSAVEYVEKVIIRTLENRPSLRFGVQFETDLLFLIERLHALKK